MMKKHFKYYLLCALMFNVLGITNAQTFKEFKKIQQEEIAKQKLQQEREIKKLSVEFDHYVHRADKEFSEYLKKEWTSYKAFQRIEVPERPKPDTMPHYKPENNINNLPARKINIQFSRPKNQVTMNKPVIPVVQKTEPEDYPKSGIDVDFYGGRLNFQFDDALSGNKLQTINEKAISNWWTEYSKTNYNLLVNQLLNNKNRLSLNDWAYFMLVFKTAMAITGQELNNANLLTWFLMIRSGYDVKIAFHDNKVHLLIPSLTELYGKSYLIINNQRFYFVDDVSTDTFQTYNFDFDGAARVMDFNISQPLNIGRDVVEKQLKFNYREKEYSFPVTLSVNSLYFLKDYPVTDLNVFFNAAMSRVTKESLADGLVPFIDKMSTDEAVNFLLSFVQKSFRYETDQEQFKKEKYFFPEEVFYYPASDCEDRAALFSYLVKHLLHLQVIGIEYPGHIATAVHITNNTTGDFFYFNNEKYTMADPTYINAPLGVTMPQYKNKEAKIIVTENNNYLAGLAGQYWDLANRWGGHRGSNLNDAITDSYGNYYLTGYYNHDVNLGKINWKQASGKRQAFIVKYNKEKEVQWAENLESDGNATGFSMVLDNMGNPVIAGSFNGTIHADGRMLKTENNNQDVFVAAYNPAGKLLWLKKSGLDTLNHDRFLNYVVKFNRNGKHVNTKLYFENAAQVSNGIFYKDSSFLVIGGINNTIGFNTGQLAFNAGNDFNTIDYLKQENDQLIKNNVNKSIAGLFAVINLIKNNGTVIPGKDAQQALDKYNPRFRSSSPDMYKNIGKVNFIKNDEGLIIFQTNYKSVSFGKIKISNGAVIKISPLQDGNKQMDVLSGIEVGKLFVWYDLNFIKMMKTTGNMLFDYDSDHTQKTINMKNDILH